MHATLIRRQLGGLVPPKIATPKLVVRQISLDNEDRLSMLIFFLFSLEDPGMAYNL